MFIVLLIIIGGLKMDILELNECEMCEINGGAISWSLLAGIGAGIVYLIGVMSGYTNPSKCNNR